MKLLPLCCALVFTAAKSPGAGGVPIDDPVVGQKLARELRSIQPTENAEFSGTLKISKPNSPEKILPLRMKVTVLPGGWKSVYEARLPNGSTESLTISHATNQAPRCELHHGDAVDAMTETNMTATFAGSDLTMLDL